jgi:dynein heavy chain
VFEALYAGKVPAAWLKAYPSLKGLGPWTRDLLARIEQLARWAEGTYPRIYWLGGFTYPTGFLTAVLQVCGFLDACAACGMCVQLDASMFFGLLFKSVAVGGLWYCYAM